MAKKTKSSGRPSMRERMKEMIENREKGGGGGTKFNFPEGHEVKWFKPKKGTMLIDFIPYETEDGGLWWEKSIYTHNDIGADGKAYVCLKTSKKPCPICEARAELLREYGKDSDIVKALNAKQRQVFNVIDLDNEDEGVQFWEMSYFLFGKLLEEELAEDDDLLDFSNLEDGLTVKVRFKEEVFNKNKFLKASKIDFVERDAYEEDILEDVLNLDEVVDVLTYEKLEAIFLEKEDADEEETPKRGRKATSDDEEEEKPKRKRKAAPVEEEEEEEETPKRKRRASKPAEEEEEEETPKRRGRKSKPEPEPEEEDEEEADDEEEEEEKPKRRGRTSKTKATPKRGRKSEPEPEEEEEEEEEKPKRKSKAKASDDEELECPAGGTFGDDCDDLDECFDCEIWEQCKEKQDSASKKTRKK